MKNIDYKIIVDTREKKNDHILEVFDKNNIKYEKRALKVGDYAIEHKGQLLDIVIERKANIDELLQNLIEKSNNDENTNRVHREFIRANVMDLKLVLLIEDSNYYKNILQGNYRSNINPNSARGLIMSLEAKYPNLSIVGIDKELVASYIHSVLYYHLREHIKLEE